MRGTWRLWLPVALSVAGVSCAVALADAGRQSAAMVLLGWSLAVGAISVGVWLHYDHGDDEMSPADLEWTVANLRAALERARDLTDLLQRDQSRPALCLAAADVDDLLRQAELRTARMPSGARPVEMSDTFAESVKRRAV